MGPALGCAGARQCDAKEKEAAADEGCGNSELYMSLRPQQPVFTQRQTAGVVESDRRGCKWICVLSVQSGTPWEGSSWSFKATS